MAKKFMGIKLAVLSSHSFPGQERLTTIIKVRPLMQRAVTAHGNIFEVDRGKSSLSNKQKVSEFRSKSNQLSASSTMMKTLPGLALAGEIADITDFLTSKGVRLVAAGKGHGFAGVVARYGFGRGPMTRGSTHHRAPGSIGAGTWPSRVYPRKKMPGRWKTPQRTYHHNSPMKLDLQHGLIWLQGSVPGKKKNTLQLSPLP